MNEIANAGRTVHPFHRNRAILFSLLALALAVLSFHGVLDNLAFAKLDELTKGTLGLLLGSVAINAAVSVLQTVELDIPFLSAQIGQVLDPINDAAERLSLVLMWATGSLFLQDLLLKITSGSIFKLGFLAIAVMTATSLLVAQSGRVRTALVTSLGISHLALAQLKGLLIKIFIVATVVRFIVPTFMIASLLVSQALLAPDIERHSRELERYEKELSEVGAQISGARDEVIEEQTTQEEIQTHDEAEDVVPDEQVEQTPPLSAQPVLRHVEGLQTLRDQKTLLEERLAWLESERERLSNEINEKQGSGWKEWIRKFADNPNEALAEANVRVEQVQSEIEHQESELACLDRRAAGGECESFLVGRRTQALGEIKTALESEQKDLRERLQSLQEEREELHADVSGEAEGKTGSRWRDKVVDALPNLFGGVATEEVEAEKPKVEDIDREIAEASALAKQKESEVTCVGLRISGEHCDSPGVDSHLQSAFDSLKEQLGSDLRGLQAERTSLQAEQKRLTELTQLEAEHRQIESQIEGNRKLIDRNESELECAERRAVGEDCNTILDDGRQLMSETWTATSGMASRATEAAGKMVSSATEATKRTLSRMSRGVWDRLKGIADGATDMVKRLTQLLVLKVIENIVLPIIFLAIALKASVPIARGLMRISTTMNEDARAALSAMDKALPSRRS